MSVGLSEIISYLSTYKEVIGNLIPIILHNINHLSIDNFPVSTYLKYMKI